MTLPESIVGVTFVTVANSEGYVRAIVVERALDEEVVLYRVIACSYEPNVGGTDWAYARALLDAKVWDRFDP